jgi:hypothetical protein
MLLNIKRKQVSYFKKEELKALYIDFEIHKNLL